MTAPKDQKRPFPLNGDLPLPHTAYNAAIKRLPMPPRIRTLPISERGYPVPWFVAKLDGVWDFRVVDTGKIRTAWRQKLCWVCGGPLGRNVAMTLGPMCIVNRTISEPGSHRDCAVYSALACPFLANETMRRNERTFAAEIVSAPGEAVLHNPGACAVWVTRKYWPFRQGEHELFTFDDPEEVLWFANGQVATHEQISAVLARTLPVLEEIAVKYDGRDALDDIARQRRAVEVYLPDPRTNAPFHHLRQRAS